jgi:ADP-heptose:LPS heptosyltransferase
MEFINKIDKILVIQIRAIGDVVLTTPVFSVLRKNLPHAELHFLTGRDLAGIVRGLPELQQVLTLPSSFWRYPAFYFKIFMTRYQLVIDYQCTPGSALITWLTRASYRIGWKMKRRQWAYNLHSSANTSQEYVSIQKCRLLELLGIRDLNTRLQIHWTDADQQVVQEYFESLGIDTNRFLVNITPKGKRSSRQWLPEKIIELSNYLSEKYQAIVFYNWGKADLDEVKSIAAACHTPPLVLPAWPLPVFSAFLAQVDLHISYDNGPKHLALAAGTATLSLFATDAPVLWNPMDDPNHPYKLANVPCRFCRLKECPLMICMKQIEPADILQIVEGIPAFQTKLRKLDKSSE